jgi:hypothetical protein
MERKWGLVVAGLAVTAVAGCSTAGMHVSGAPHAHSKPVVAAAAAQQATPRVEQARVVAVSGSGSASGSGRTAFRRWWVSGGYRQYQNVASDLSKLIITDSLRDNDGTFYADAKRLIADAATASRHLPPVDAAGYRAGMRELVQVGRDAFNGSYDTAYLHVRAGLPKLAAFNNAISGWDTSAPAASTVS